MKSPSLRGDGDEGSGVGKNESSDSSFVAGVGGTIPLATFNATVALLRDAFGNDSALTTLLCAAAMMIMHNKDCNEPWPIEHFIFKQQRGDFVKVSLENEINFPSSSKTTDELLQQMLWIRARLVSIFVRILLPIRTLTIRF